ncbi:MAG: iron-containing alcohol dehydrogenase, partial [Pseudomonadota bacterium]
MQGRVEFGRMGEVIFGRPAAEAVSGLIPRLGAERVFVMASATLNRETEAVSDAISALGPRFAALCDHMPAHTPRSAVVAATEQARAADADLILTFGGGSVTDGAKAVSLCLANDVRTVEDMDALRVPPGEAQSPGAAPAVRQVSIPTTLSAGEFSSLSGVSDERTKTKELFKHPGVIPQAVILDPAATIHTPEWLFLSTGVRAVDHCVEGVCSLESHPYGDAQGLKGLELLARGLKAVHADPGDLEARLECQMGAWLSMGPLASGVPMGASHGIGYILGALHGVPHGHTSCVMLPPVMRWNKPANALRQEMVAGAMGRGEAADLLQDLIGGIGMPTTLGDVGVGEADFQPIAEGAMKTP